MTINSEYFYGNHVSSYGLENKRVDYGTLAKAFDAVLNNNIIPKTGWEYWECISGYPDYSEEKEEKRDKITELENKIYTLREDLKNTPDTDEDEITIATLQDRIEELEQQIDILEDGIQELEDAETETPEIYQFYIVSESGAKLLQKCNEIVYYNDNLDMYVWGVTHYGTGWAYVLTDIVIDI